MERKTGLIHSSILYILYVLYFVGAVGHSFDLTKELMLLLTPYTLLIAGGLVFYLVLPQNGKLITWTLFVYFSTFTIEVIGVKTGFIFGSYSYGDVLGVKLFDTPLLIGFNWVLVILGAVVLAGKFTNNKYLIVFIAATLAVMFDIILEPVAITYGYWNWQNNIIPLQNYIAWCVIAVAAAGFYMSTNVKLKSNLVIHYFLIQTGFFIVLNLGL